MNILLPCPDNDAIILFSILIFPSVLFPPETAKLPPILTFFSIPTPPSTIIAPVSLSVD